MSSTGVEVFKSFTDSLNKVEKSIWDFSSNTVGYFDELALTLFLLYSGYLFIKGDSSSAKANLFRTFVAIPLIVIFTTNYNNYESYIKEPILDLNSYFVKGVLKSINSSSFNNDNINNQIEMVENAMLKDGFKSLKDGMSIGEIFQSIMILFLMIVLFFSFAFVLIRFVEGYFGMFIMLLISPITLFFICFNHTKGITIAWFRGLITYFLYAPLTSIIVAITLSMINIKSLDVDNIEAIIVILINCVVSIYFLLKVPEYANILTSGSSSGAGIGGIMSASSSAFNTSKESINISKQSIQSLSRGIGNMVKRKV